MAAFVTEFPVDDEGNIESFFEVIRDWISNSPHTTISKEDIGLIGTEQFSRQSSGSETIESWRFESEVEQYSAAAISYTKSESGSDVSWHIEVVFSKNYMDCWVGIRVETSALKPKAKLPVARKPLIISYLLERMGGSVDGMFKVASAPHYLDYDQVTLASSIVENASVGRLPTIYISCKFDGSYEIDPSAIASDLAGTSHVVVEPSRVFSRDLQLATNSRNVYGGSVGVYWPDGGGRDIFFIGADYPDSKSLKRGVIDLVTSSLSNRIQQSRTTIEHVQSGVSQIVLKSIRESLEKKGIDDVNDYIHQFDEDSRVKQRRIDALEAELSRLNEQRSISARGLIQSEPLLHYPDREQEFYDGEFAAVVGDELVKLSDNVVKDSRRQHIIAAIIEKNRPQTNSVARQKEELRNILTGYSKMDPKTRSALTKMGFAISDDGKHHKLTYKGDDRYTFTLAKSGSDHRGSKNAIADIGRLLF